MTQAMGKYLIAKSADLIYLLWGLVSAGFL
jgi:hypothetical protein